jgi:nucleoside-diphosphate-sugar epimerase
MNKVIEEDFKFIYSHTKDIWFKAANSTIFITGATGFFGKCLLSNFLYANSEFNLNIKVIILSRDPQSFILAHPEFNNESFIYIKGNVKNFEFPANQNIDYIIHAATDTNAQIVANEPLTTFETIVDGTKQILELAKNKNVKSVLNVSSGAVYGKQPHTLSHVTEEFTGAPNVYDVGASYGEGKRVAEMFCNIYHEKHGVNVKIARCYAFVGTYLPLDTHFAIGNFIHDIINDRQIKIQGDGSPFRTYLYTADLVIWLLKILFDGKACHPYNVGSDVAVNIEELANTVNTFSKKHKPIEILKPKSDGHPVKYVPSIERAKSELGLSVYTSLQDAIDRTIRFYTSENTK